MDEFRYLEKCAVTHRCEEKFHPQRETKSGNSKKSDYIENYALLSSKLVNCGLKNI